MNKRQMSKLLEDIRENRCILMLGSSLCAIKKDDTYWPLTKLFAENLALELQDESISYEETEAHNLTYIAQKYLNIEDVQWVDLNNQAKKFIEKNTLEVIPYMAQLAKLPFSLIINTSPDNMIYRALIKEGKNANLLYYNFRKDKNTKEALTISPTSPLVYNFFGKTDDLESIVITEEDRVEFIRSVIQDAPPLPSHVLQEFDKTKTYIFLGFDFEQWEFRLLLESLQLPNANRTFAPSSPYYKLSSKTTDFFKHRYRFTFVEDDVEAFIQQLSDRFFEKEVIAKGKKTVVIYKKEDAEVAEKLMLHLQDLLHSNWLSTIWHEGLVQVGENEKIAKTKNFDEAEIFIPLLSADFFHENDDILSMFEKVDEGKGVKVYPVIARPVEFQSSRFSKHDVLPISRTPLLSSEWDNLDEACQQVVKELKKILQYE